MVALQGDVAFARLGEARHSVEFAFGDAVGKVFTSQHIFEVFDVIYLVHTFLGRYEQSNLIPFARWLGSIDNFLRAWVDRRLIETVEPAAPNGIARLALSSS